MAGMINGNSHRKRLLPVFRTVAKPLTDVGSPEQETQPQTNSAAKANNEIIAANMICKIKWFDIKVYLIFSRKSVIPSTCSLTIALLPASDNRKSTSSLLSWKRFSVSTAGHLVSRQMARSCCQ